MVVTPKNLYVWQFQIKQLKTEIFDYNILTPLRSFFSVLKSDKQFGNYGSIFNQNGYTRR